jgi:hypothetical protein
VMAQGNRIVPLVASLLGLAFFAVANGGLLDERLFQGELMAICILLVFISLIVTLFWKISIHLIAWGSVGVFTSLYAITTGQWWVLGVVVPITAATAWARYYLKSHDWKQLVVGYLAGICAAVLIVLAFP